MKQNYFVKFDPRINKRIGCQRATLVLSAMEYWFEKKPDGFYKFMEPCSHRLYKKGDSWEEVLGFERRCFSRSFQKIGVKYRSRMEFEAAPDKFQGKMYASYYDRYTNQTFFIRNHDLADEFLKDFSTPKAQLPQKGTVASQPKVSLQNLPLSTGQNGLSYIEPNNTSNDLFKNKSQAGSEIAKKMVEVWTALVEQSKTQISLTSKRVAFLNKAFSDKFDSCLERWKEFCQRIASSRFLMGEIKSSFKATLDWALKFEVIQKVFEGCYGIGDKAPATPVPDYECLLAQIASLEEPGYIQEFRLRCLHQLGGNTYVSWFKNLSISLNGDTLSLSAPSGFTASYLHRTFSTDLRVLLEGFDQSVSSLSVYVQGDPKEKLRIERERTPCPPLLELGTGKEGEIQEEAQEGMEVSSCPSQQVEDFEEQHEFPAPTVYEIIRSQSTSGEGGKEPTCEGTGENEGQERRGAYESMEPVNLETKNLREQLRKSIPPQNFPSWLDRIEFESLKPDGTLVVGFEDQLMVEWCRSRFSQDILQAAKGIWGGVRGLAIQEKNKNSGFPQKPFDSPPVASPSLSSQVVRGSGGNVLKKRGSNRFEKAIASLMSARSFSVSANRFPVERQTCS